jgi:hypothetical protein
MAAGGCRLQIGALWSAATAHFFRSADSGQLITKG